MLRKITPWLLFILCLLLLGLGATPFGPRADHVAVGLRFAIVIFLSILFLEQKFGNRKGAFLESFTRWSRGENKRPR